MVLPVFFLSFWTKPAFAYRSFRAWSAATLVLLGACPGTRAQTVTQETGGLSPVVVTATARPETSTRITSTTQVLDRAAIERSTASSITDFMGENAVGFLSEFGPTQTLLNIRGAATNGQGRDFRSQVLVLVNGRRTGTANLSKLSLADVERIEIVRGPSSVVYGSQSMGGVINIILKRGTDQPPTLADVRTGSWGLRQAHVQTGGMAGDFDWYLGVHAGARNAYKSGYGSTMKNTDWERRGASLAAGWQMTDLHRLDANLRTDGIFDAGFRGSGSNTYNRDDRYNRSADLLYTGETASGQASWTAHLYTFKDVDQFNWASPVRRVGEPPNAVPMPNTSRDYNLRQLYGTGVRLQPRLQLFEGNDLLLGMDAERSRLRSDRVRVALPGGPAGQVAPYDVNQTERVYALYFEDAQDVWHDRLTLRGGLRKTWGRTRTDPTPNLALQRTASRSYDALTWSLGSVLRVNPNLSLRTSAATGFRAPTATELAADFTSGGGGRTFGNANLKPERSRQFELGATWLTTAWRLDGALFHNTISHRIRAVSRGPGTNTSDYANNSADIVVRGLEWGADLNVSQALGWQGAASRIHLFGNGYYHFSMRDKGAPATANNNSRQGMYRYELAGGVRYRHGQDNQTGAWGVQLSALLRGPMWNNTEENLLVPQSEPHRGHIHRKGSFTVWNLRGDVQMTRTLKLYAAVNNLFNKNEHPIFLSYDRGAACIADIRFQTGGCGTSMPGRDFQLGLRASF